MKTVQTILTLILLTAWSAQVYSADLVVRELGSGGAYSSIQTAINFASDGDRIVVAQRAGNTPWTESITISKSITLLPEVEGQHVNISGSIALFTSNTSSFNGKEVNFIDVDLTGNFTGGYNSRITRGSFTVNVSFFNCSASNIDFDQGVIVNAINCTANLIAGHAGKIIGCQVQKINMDADDSDYRNLSSSIQIYGNRIIGADAQIKIITRYSSALVENNFVNPTSGTASIFALDIRPISISKILNNTVVLSNTNQNGILAFRRSASSSIQVFSNIVRSSGTTNPTAYSIENSANVTFSYNLADEHFTTFLTDASDNGTNYPNITYSTFSVLPDTGLAIGVDIFDKGHPNEIFTDLNLTRNDLGCYGGSKTQLNYFPANPDGPRVYFLNIPNRVIIGSSLDVQAETYDHKE